MGASKRWLIVLAGLVALTLLLYLGRPSASIFPLAELEGMWVERMLEERSEDVAFYTSDQPRIHSPAQVVQPFLASPTGFRELRKAIRIHDSRGSYLWDFFGTGLSAAGGWELQGGLLEEVTLPVGDTLDLFLMRATYWHPAMTPLWGPLYLKRDVHFKIFLVRRDRAAHKADILRTWEIQPAQVEWKYPPGFNLLDPMTTASLTYDRNEKQATVTITGIDRDITAHVEIGDKTR